MTEVYPAAAAPGRALTRPARAMIIAGRVGLPRRRPARTTPESIRTGPYLRSFVSRLWVFALALVGLPSAASEAMPELAAARAAGWKTASTIAVAMAVSDAKRFPAVQAWIREVRSLAPKPDGRTVPVVDADRLVTRNPGFWRAYFEVSPGEPAMMLLHSGLLLAGGEAARAAYVLVIARQQPGVAPEMRDAIDGLLGHAQALIGAGARVAAEGVKLHDAGAPAKAIERFNATLALWPQNALAHYEQGLATVAQQYTGAGKPAPARVRLGLFSELRPSQEALASYARARQHDPLLILAYQAGDTAGTEVLVALGKKVRPVWEAIAKDSVGEAPDDVMKLLSEGLQEAQVDEIAIAARQVLVAREKGYDARDRAFVAASVRRLVPGPTSDAVVKRIAAPKAEFLRVIMP